MSIREKRNKYIQMIAAIFDREDEKSIEQKTKEATELINQLDDPILEKTFLRLAVEEQQGKVINSKFWKCENRIGTDDLILRKVEERDKEGFLSVQEDNFPIKSYLKEESCREMLWQGHNALNSLMFSIVQREEYVGYCGIKNISRDECEIAIELKKVHTNKGIGYRAISLMLDTIKQYLGKTEFIVKIEPQNNASQKLFEKLGAVPDGVVKFLLYDEEQIQKFEEEHQNLLTKEIIQVANKFGVEPKKLLSHVLQYRLMW